LKEYLICDGCGGKIFAGDEVLNLNFIDLVVHKNMDCLLQLDEVQEGTVKDIKTTDPNKFAELVRYHAAIQSELPEALEGNCGPCQDCENGANATFDCQECERN
jgi:hypothetical protein